MRRCTSLNADQTRRQLLEKRQNVATLQLTADHHLAGSSNAVHLKHRFCDVETDCRNCLHRSLLRIMGALVAPISMALTCRVEEPSTASTADVEHLTTLSL